MAKKTSNTPVFKGYVPVYLSDEQKAAIRKNMPKPEQLFDKLNRLAEDDYRITIGWDEYNQCISSSMYDMNPKRPSAGYILAGRHVDFMVAVAAMVYLHEVIHVDGWDIEHVDNGNKVNW